MPALVERPSRVSHNIAQMREFVEDLALDLTIQGFVVKSISDPAWHTLFYRLKYPKPAIRPNAAAFLDRVFFYADKNSSVAAYAVHSDDLDSVLARVLETSGAKAPGGSRDEWVISNAKNERGISPPEMIAGRQKWSSKEYRQFVSDSADLAKHLVAVRPAPIAATSELLRKTDKNGQPLL